jgi:hypothetical protein
VSPTGDYLVRLVPRDADGNPVSYADMRLGRETNRTAVSGEFYFNFRGEGPGSRIDFASMTAYPEDFEVEGKMVTGGVMFTVSRVNGLLVDSEFLIAAGLYSFGVRGTWGDEPQGYELQNPEDIPGAVDVGEGWLEMTVHAEDLESEEEARELDGPLLGEIVNVKPAAEAGPGARTVECASYTTTPVLLDGSESEDYDDGDGISHYQWFSSHGAYGEDTGISNQDKAWVNLPLGEHGFSLHVYDMKLGADRDDIEINVVDTTPPELEVSPVDVCVWPPNHKFVKFELGQEIRALVRDTCDPDPAVSIVDVTTYEASSEPDDGLGDGHTTGDIRWGPDAACVRLRVERSGTGEGRVYTIRVEARDFTGNSSFFDVYVRVPHDHEPGCITMPTYDEDDPVCQF